VIGWRQHRRADSLIRRAQHLVVALVEPSWLLKATHGEMMPSRTRRQRADGAPMRARPPLRTPKLTAVAGIELQRGMTIDRGIS
jgi:hypothetical protein